MAPIQSNEKVLQLPGLLLAYVGPLNMRGSILLAARRLDIEMMLEIFKLVFSAPGKLYRYGSKLHNRTSQN